MLVIKQHPSNQGLLMEYHIATSKTTVEKAAALISTGLMTNFERDFNVCIFPILQFPHTADKEKAEIIVQKAYTTNILMDDINSFKDAVTQFDIWLHKTKVDASSKESEKIKKIVALLKEVIAVCEK